MVTTGKSGFSLSLCVSLWAEEAVLYASTGLAQVKTLHYNACLFKNRSLRHLTYILHVLTLLCGGCQLTYLLHSFNPPLPSQTSGCNVNCCQMGLFVLTACWTSLFILSVRLIISVSGRHATDLRVITASSVPFLHCNV